MRQYLCIGGPLNGQELTWTELSDTIHGREYNDYNSSSGYRGVRSMVRIHDSLVTVPKKAVKPW